MKLMKHLIAALLCCACLPTFGSERAQAPASISLAAGGTLQGSAGTASAITWTVFGTQQASSVEAYGPLGNGVLTGTATALITAPASNADLITAIVLENTTGSDVPNVNLYVNGSASSNQFSSFTVPANNTCTFTNEWSCVNGAGAHTSASTGGSTYTAGPCLTLSSGAFTLANVPSGVPCGGTGTATLSGILKGNGTSAIGSAVSGTDYSAGTSALGTGIVKSTTGTGALSIAIGSDFPTLNQNTLGSAATLTTPRAINGVNFDGSAAITVPAAAGTLTGSALASGITSSSLTSLGTLANLTVTNPIAGSVTGSSGSSTGNSATASALSPGNTINGVSFTGAAPITVAAAAGTLTGSALASGVTSSSLTSVGTLAGLTVTAPIAGSLTGNAGTVTTNANLTGPVTSSGNATTITPTITAGGPTGSATVAPIVTFNAAGQLTAVSSATITPAVGSITGLGTGCGTWLATPSSANLATCLTDETGTGNVAYSLTAVLKPKDISGRVYVDCANTNAWSGSDFGAWVNSAYAYIHTTYTDTNGGVIVVAPGSCSYSTPIVLCDAGLMAIQMIGAGDGNGATIFNYTPATATTAISVCGGSGNDGGVQLADFTITGSAQGNGATAIQMGVTGTGGIAGATLKNVSIRRFTTGINWATGGISYGHTLINVKVQQCTTGAVPFGENNVFMGGLLGNNATGLSLANNAEVQLFGVAFDDNTTTGISQSNSSVRSTLDGVRFENAGGGTDTYITLSAGTMTVQGGYMGTDAATGTSTGFIQHSGGVLDVNGTTAYSAGRTVTQMVAMSGTAYANLNFKILPIASGILTSFTSGYTNVETPTQSSSVDNYNAAAQSLTVVAGTETYVTSSNLNIPAAFTPGTGIRVGTTFIWEVKIVKSAVGTGSWTWKIHAGTAGTIADAAIATQAWTQTAALDDCLIRVQVTITSTGATGGGYWSINPMCKAATATGFGAVVGTAYDGTFTSFNTTISALVFGLGFTSATGTPVVTVPLVTASIKNLG